MPESSLLSCRPVDEITLPVSGSVDITLFRPIIDSPEFQKLGYRDQLGFARTTFRGATHTRLCHSLGTGELTKRRIRKLVEWGYITQAEALAVWLYGFDHDTGHGPGCHVTDPLVKVGHDERAIAIFSRMRGLIEACGVDYDLFMDIAARKNPLSQIVSHTPLGTDKLDYMARDAHYSGIKGMLDLDIFMNHVYFLDGRLAADAKIVNYVDQLAEFYRLLYAEIYFKTSVMLTERYVQRMIGTLLGVGEYPAVLTEDELVEMTDGELEYTLSHAKDPVIRAQYARVITRTQPRPAVVFVRYPENYWAGSFPMKYVEAPMSLFNHKDLRKPAELYGIERKIEESLGMPKFSILVAPPVPWRRFMPPEVDFIVDGGQFRTFRDLRSDEYDAQIKAAEHFAALYVATDMENCASLNDPGVVGRISEIVMRYA